MKWTTRYYGYGDFESPSMRREWIEIAGNSAIQRTGNRSPSMRREWIEMLGAAHMGRY